MAHWKMVFLCRLTLLWTMLGSASGFPTGAPASACNSMMPLHLGVQPQTTPAPYELLVGAPSFTNGQPISVQILGSFYRGLLLEARTFGSTAALGFWQAAPNNTKLLECSRNPQAAVTHSNSNIKTEQTTFAWLPPNPGCPKVITFVATVAQSHDIYWTNVKSKVIWRNPKATCGAETFSRSLSVTGALSYLLLFSLGYI